MRDCSQVRGVVGKPRQCVSRPEMETFLSLRLTYYFRGVGNQGFTSVYFHRLSNRLGFSTGGSESPKEIKKHSLGGKRIREMLNMQL